jgi:nucleotide-binding universal stress UspA family protein
MAVRSLITQVQDTPTGRARLAFAASFAKAHGAELIGVGVQAFTPYVTSTGAFGFVDGAAVQAIRDEIDRELEAAKALFEKTVAEAGIASAWRSTLGDPTEVISRLARSADLVVASRIEKGSGPAFTAFASDLVVAAGRPVLVVPAEPAPFRLDHAVVGWKESREARRAVADALPLLAEAGQVTVVEIADSDDLEDAKVRTDAVAAYLVRHGVKAKGDVVKLSHGRVAEQILKMAVAQKADLLVTGAYAHPRLREWVFGGVTQDLLDNAPLPCLLSH